MGFLTGRVSYLRFRVDGPAPGLFDEGQLEKLAANAIGKQKGESKDGSQAGWIAGDDILDVGFDLSKNVIADTLHFAIRLDTCRLPGDLLRAYVREELQVLAAENPSGKPSTRQRKEAKETARIRLENQAADGRYTRRKSYPLLWDALSNQVLVGTTSGPVLDHVQRLFHETFGCSLSLLGAGRLALERPAPAGAEPAFDPSAFVPGAAGEVAWSSDPAIPAHMGNEFLLWLWFVLEMEGDSVPLKDKTEVTGMLTRTLLLECPRGVSGSETIRSEGPTRLPEARKAVQAGKLPRQAGLILVRHANQYEFALQAETLGVGGAKLPACEESEERARLEERVTQLRHMIETLDLLFDVFLERRLGPDWNAELARMQRWLQREEPMRQSA